MAALERLARRVWATPGGAADVLLWPLGGLSWLYARAAAARAAAYATGNKPRQALPVPVISVGNLAVGGTGKTPLTMLLARELTARGRRVGILTRGYGGSNEGEDPIMVSLGAGALVGPDVSGDEPALMAASLPGVPVAAGARRAEAGRLLLQCAPVDVLLMDDGFQHHALVRDADVVLVDGASPFGNGHCLPRGSLREPPAALGRADLIVARDPPPGADPQTALAAFSAAPVATARTRVAGVFDASDKRIEVGGRKVLAVCGIAAPGRFAATLAETGARPAGFMAFADHAPYDRARADAIAAEAERLGAEAVVTTGKDAVKLAPLWRGATPLWTVRIELAVDAPDGGDWVAALLDLAARRFAGRP
ncbi:MAG: tetraacyldisaccharide 4'-kinase [Nitrospirae bacterium]|nr:tetraacyldisaccharide 4'-kinase [Nitrospirota bacterium]